MIFVFKIRLSSKMHDMPTLLSVANLAVLARIWADILYKILVNKI